MGCHANITAEKFPKQGDLVGKAVSICFQYNTANKVEGVCIRDDNEDPFITLFMLADKRCVLATECQYQPVL